jgi:uroporphyrin-3 C-methyltransferase
LIRLAIIAVIAAIAWYGNILYQKTLKLEQALQTSQEKQLHLEQESTRLAKKMQQLLRYEKHNGWFIETESLLVLARQQLMLHRDPEKAAELLSQADRLLAKKSISLVGDVRKQVQHEQQALARYRKIDQEKIYFQIEAVIRQIQKLPVVDLKSAGKKQEAENILPDSASIAERILQSLYRALHHIGAYIRVQQNDLQTQALLTPDEQAQLKMRLQSVLEQAQLALLQNEASIYESSLNRAIDLIRQYYLTDPTGKETLLKDLQTLAHQSVDTDLPEIGASLRALRALQMKQEQSTRP